MMSGRVAPVRSQTHRWCDMNQATGCFYCRWVVQECSPAQLICIREPARKHHWLETIASSRLVQSGKRPKSARKSDLWQPEAWMEFLVPARALITTLLRLFILVRKQSNNNGFPPFSSHLGIIVINICQKASCPVIHVPEHFKLRSKPSYSIPVHFLQMSL